MAKCLSLFHKKAIISLLCFTPLIKLSLQNASFYLHAVLNSNPAVNVAAVTFIDIKKNNFLIAATELRTASFDQNVQIAF